jgi:hypothetical protein
MKKDLWTQAPAGHCIAAVLIQMPAAWLGALLVLPPRPARSWPSAEQLR